MNAVANKIDAVIDAIPGRALPGNVKAAAMGMIAIGVGAQATHLPGGQATGHEAADQAGDLVAHLGLGRGAGHPGTDRPDPPIP